jgi:hypothetical protein
MGSAFQIGDKMQPALLKRADFPLPELGAGKFIKLRALGAGEMRAREAKERAVRKAIVEASPGLSDREITIKMAEDPTLMGNFLIAQCAVNEDGSQIFTDDTDADGKVTKTAAQKVDELLDVGTYSIVGMVNKIMELSGLPTGAASPKN